MIKMYVFAIFIWILLNHFVNGDETKYHRAAFRARLAKAKSIHDALIIIKTSNTKNRMASISSPDTLKKEQQTLFATAQQSHKQAHSIIEPRNGGCEPRVVCEEVPVDRATSNNMVSFPQCVEVHRCGGCCQEAQFPCVPVKQEQVTFSPLLLISLDDTGRYEVNRALTLMNHTECECKCSKKEDQCHREGKTLDLTLCQCIQPRCSPECLISSTCSIVSGSDTPRCACRRRIQGQNSNFCPTSNQRPNSMCTRCETANG